MVAAERNEVLDPRGLLLDRGQALRNVAKRNREVADVGYRQRGWIDPVHRMVAVHQHPACLSNRGRSEAGPGPIGGAEVKGNAGDTNRHFGIVAVDPEEGRRHGESRDHSRARPNWRL